MKRSGIKTLRDPRHGKIAAETVRRAHAAGGWQEGGGAQDGGGQQGEQGAA